MRVNMIFLWKTFDYTIKNDKITTIAKEVKKWLEKRKELEKIE